MAQPIARFEKPPSSALGYTVDWSSWLPSGETISAVEWSVSPSGLTYGNPSNTLTTATVRLSGGTLGTGYNVCCRVTTTPGQYSDERTFFVDCKQR